MPGVPKDQQLTELQVLEIRMRVEAGEAQATMAWQYKVSPQTINDIIKRRSWKNI